MNLRQARALPIRVSSRRTALIAVVVMAVVPAAAAAGHARRSIRDTMVDIPGGRFAMGSDDADASESEKPVHPVAVAGFRLDKTEVTVKAYAECVRVGRCSEPEAYLNERGTYQIFCNWRHPQKRDEHPVNCVDFQQAVAFCAWAGKRLPSEEEWEYAARGGGEERKFPWGNDPPNEKRLNACGRECPQNLRDKRFPGGEPLYPADDGWPETAPVGRFPAGASKDGALDLAGNVWEWTASLYTSYDGSRTENKRVLRGGSWGGMDARTERTTNRFRLDPASRGQFLGFRCAK